MDPKPFVTFSVGPKTHPLNLHFDLVIKENTPNVQSREPIPPLNIHGLRRLAKTCAAIAELLENTPSRS
jgi:hypothetical protein